MPFKSRTDAESKKASFPSSGAVYDSLYKYVNDRKNRSVDLMKPSDIMAGMKDTLGVPSADYSGYAPESFRRVLLNIKKQLNMPAENCRNGPNVISIPHGGDGKY